jgi:hypothetical protein
MGEETFEISGKVNKLTISPLAMTSIPPPQTNANTAQRQRPAMIEWWDQWWNLPWSVIQSRFPLNLSD